jgi:probable addiction module antidote protein
MKAAPKSRPIEVMYDKLFKDSELAIDYLQTCLEDGGLSLFLAGLQNVVRAQGGIARFAKKLKVPRQTLYRALSKTGNPEARTVWAVVDGLGFKLVAVPKKRAARSFKRPVKMSKAA